MSAAPDPTMDCGGHHLAAVVPPRPVERPDGVWWVWRPLHGGAGTTTLAGAVPCGAEYGTDPRLEDLPWVAVVRSHAAGLGAATEWASQIGKTVPAGQVLGLVIVADAPGRLPRELESMIRLASTGYPATWRIPWVHEWRLGHVPTPKNLPAGPCRQLLRDLTSAVGISLTNPSHGGT